MKKKIIIFTVVIILIGFGIYGGLRHREQKRIKNATIIVEVVDNLKIEFNDKKHVSDFIKSLNGQITNNFVIDSSKVGKQNVTIEYKNDENIDVTYDFEVEIVDTVEPVIWLGNSYKVKRGSHTNIVDNILCGDNYDPNPKCEIVGEYDLDTVGNYKLQFRATDSSGNVATQDFTLKVYEPSKNTNTTKTTTTKTNFSDVVAKYKTNDTKIGIDISKWQGTIDFKKVKDAGVEFAIVRVGYYNGEKYVLDSKFKEYMQGLAENDIPVGIYFYSYADSYTQAISDAVWVISQIKDYKIEYPVAFDWEEWADFNSYNLSFYQLSSIGETFLDVVNIGGYKGLWYSSKSYLKYIWYPSKYDTWLAHYTNNLAKSDYEGEYKYWQICADGRVDGIKGDVDIDIMFK